MIFRRKFNRLFFKIMNSVKLLATFCCYHMAQLYRLHFTLQNVVSTKRDTLGSYGTKELDVPG